MAEKKEEEDIWQCSECYSTEVKITTSDGKSDICKSCFKELPSYKDSEENICYWCDCAFATEMLINIDEYLACEACIEKGGSEETPIFWCEYSSPHYSTALNPFWVEYSDIITERRCEEHPFIIHHLGVD